MCTVGASSVTDLGPTDAAGDDEGGEGMREPLSTAEDRWTGFVAPACERRLGCDLSSPVWPAGSLARESVSATVEVVIPDAREVGVFESGALVSAVSLATL